MNSITSVFRIVRDFLFSNINKQFLTFLFFLSLSGIFWMMLTLVETYEKELKIPVQISQIPNNVVLTSDDVDTVRITVRDRGWMILSYLYGNQLKRVYANFKNYNRGNGYGVIPANELMKLIHAQNPIMTSKITSIKPEKLEYFYNDGAHKRVPVRWSGRVIPEHLYFISQTQYWPDSVDVYASPGKLDSITVAYTETLNYANFRDTLIVDCQMAKVKGVKCVPEHIKVGFYTDVLTEESIDDIPIIALNMPEGKVLRTFPAKVKVSFVTGVSQFRNLRPEQFVVTADYKEIIAKPSDKCNIYLKSVPSGISRATLDLKQVDYLIEEE
ncbi:MAG: YbbR-like domain-containing protein [Prevotella sp.]|nr:YbbR-like domain-containing protein [Prevotella sp.]